VKYRVIIGLFIGIMSAPALCAANISVLVMESGENIENTGNQYPIIWENEIMAILFDAGHIVSNSPKMHVAGKVENDLPAEAEREFIEAKDGGMEYFLVALIDYAAPMVILRIFDIKSTKKVLEQKYAITSFKNTKNETDRIKTAIRVLSAQIK
jgi:hypothetical protein